jgi:hypothetical protein
LAFGVQEVIMKTEFVATSATTSVAFLRRKV